VELDRVASWAVEPADPVAKQDWGEVDEHPVEQVGW
jgi:hypothetical protein